MSYFSQMVGLAVQNFVSAAVGIAVLAAFIRGLASRSTTASSGTSEVDLTRVLLYILLPLSVVGGLFLVSQGVIQNLDGYTTVTRSPASSRRSLGPVASQEAIKLLGTNGGGFFNVNSAMPFENPTWLTNFFEMLMILVIPAGLTATFGRMVGSRRQGWAIFAAMMTLFIVAVAVVYAAEVHPTRRDGRRRACTAPNLEGKEQRFGIASSSLFAAVTTAASCGAVNAAMESLTGLGGAVPMSEMMTGEVIFGGVGSGLYGMLLFVILGVFISRADGRPHAGVPRQEDRGARDQAHRHRHDRRADDGAGHDGARDRRASGASRRSTTAARRASRRRCTPTSRRATTTARRSPATPATSSPTAPTTAPSGSRFADLLGGVAMLGGRFLPMLAALAIAGSLAGKRVAPPASGTLRTDTPTFVVVLIVGDPVVALLTFVPALLLGPVVQGLTDQLF